MDIDTRFQSAHLSLLFTSLACERTHVCMVCTSFNQGYPKQSKFCPRILHLFVVKFWINNLILEFQCPYPIIGKSQYHLLNSCSLY